mmetsp:Transcript_18122/g.41658  ORF Transcript_18122/g.41658 Transcript_18122/m.41658 type:complete len:383 (-) Transcript_18122:231-1379(-)
MDSRKALQAVTLLSFIYIMLAPNRSSLYASGPSRWQDEELSSTIPATNVNSTGIVEETEDEYAYLILQYHKTGWLITKKIKSAVSSLTSIRRGGRVYLRTSRYNDSSDCPSARLRPHQLYIYSNPSLFCDATSLVDTLSAHARVKILHFVRNPFSLAVSNYLYHRQDPTPEEWVHDANPCAGLISSTFRNETSGYSIMSDSDFRTIGNICRGLFRTRPGLEDKGYYEHLLSLPPEEGLELATCHIVIASMVKMVNTIIKFEQINRYYSENPALEERLEILTISMDRLQKNTWKVGRRAFDFVLGPYVSDNVKDYLATRLRNDYRRRTRHGNSHITSSEARYGNSLVTSSEVEEKERLLSYLRGHQFWSRVLGNMELVTDSVT